MPQINAAGDIAFFGTFTRPDASTPSAIWRGPPDDLQLVTHFGDEIDFGPLGVRTVNGILAFPRLRDGSGNEDGRPSQFSDNGQLVFRVFFLGGPEAILISPGARDDVIVDFGPLGLWVLLNNTSLAGVTGSDPEAMVIADVDGSGQDDVVVDFGPLGLWVFLNGTSLAGVTGSDPEAMVVGDIDGN